ncbi:MAG: hypothetical protein MZU91_13050 [Desulfosudis oleivorans]|nr:hypothetical protein [Desulfosudis oleivorans]
MEVTGDGGLSVSVAEKLLGRRLKLHPDLLVLSTGIVPRDNSSVAQQLKVPLTSDGFFSEAHMKLRPVDFSLVGSTSAGPPIPPTMGDDAAGQALPREPPPLLSRDELETKGVEWRPGSAPGASYA